MQRIFWGTLVVLFPLLLVLAGGLGWRFYHKLESEVVARFSSHRWEVPSKIYAESVLLYPGLRMTPEDLRNQLDRLDYHSVEGVIQAGGDYQYHQEKNELNLFLRSFLFPGYERQEKRVRLVWRGG